MNPLRPELPGIGSKSKFFQVVFPMKTSNRKSILTKDGGSTMYTRSNSNGFLLLSSSSLSMGSLLERFLSTALMKALGFRFNSRRISGRVVTGGESLDKGGRGRRGKGSLRCDNCGNPLQTSYVEHQVR